MIDLSIKSSPKVLISLSSFSATNSEPRRILEEMGLEIVDNPFNRRLTKEEVMELLQPDVVGLIAGLEPLDRDVLSHSNLKVLSRCGVGMENVDRQAAKELGIEVRSTPDGPTEAVAELTLGALLSLHRNITSLNQDMHQGVWKKRIGGQLKGKCIVIIGYGRIGRRLSELLRPFDMRILVVDPVLKDKDLSIEVHELHQALAQADIVSLHADSSECILGQDEIKLIKKGAWILNASRGHLIDEKAILDAVKSNQISGVWCDAFVQEPYKGLMTQNSAFLLTPHIGSYTKECRNEMEAEAARNCVDVLKAQSILL